MTRLKKAITKPPLVDTLINEYLDQNVTVITTPNSLIDKNRIIECVRKDVIKQISTEIKISKSVFFKKTFAKLLNSLYIIILNIISSCIFIKSAWIGNLFENTFLQLFH